MLFSGIRIVSVDNFKLSFYMANCKEAIKNLIYKLHSFIFVLSGLFFFLCSQVFVMFLPKYFQFIFRLETLPGRVK